MMMLVRPREHGPSCVHKCVAHPQTSTPRVMNIIFIGPPASHQPHFTLPLSALPSSHLHKHPATSPALARQEEREGGGWRVGGGGRGAEGHITASPPLPSLPTPPITRPASPRPISKFFCPKSPEIALPLVMNLHNDTRNLAFQIRASGNVRCWSTRARRRAARRCTKGRGTHGPTGGYEAFFWR